MGELEEAFKKAAEIAKLVPPPLQEAAFKRALDELLSKPTRPPLGGRPADEGTSNSPAHIADVVGQFERAVDRTRHPEVMQDGRVLDKALRVLRIAQVELKIDGLKASDIARILSEKFRVSAKPNAVQMALDSRPEYVDRTKRDGVYHYRLMVGGEKYLDGETRDAPPQKRSARKVAVAERGPQEPSVVSGDEKGPPERGRISSGRPGPKPMLEQLIQGSYFDKTHTASDVMVHLRDTRALTYTIADFGPAFTRLVREGKLQREKNSDGQYTYRRPAA